MNELQEAARSGGKSMTFFGVIAIILGILAMMMPGLTGGLGHRRSCRPMIVLRAGIVE